VNKSSLELTMGLAHVARDKPLCDILEEQESQVVEAQRLRAQCPQEVFQRGVEALIDASGV
jgi:hypothetical protein